MSIASAICGSMLTVRGTIRISWIATRSKRAICSRTNASPPARTPAMAASATRSASASLALRRVSMACRAASASGESALNVCIARFLDPRAHFADPLSICSVCMASDAQPRRDLGDQVLNFELVHADRLAGLDEVDHVRREVEHRRQLDRSGHRDDVRAKLPLFEILPCDARILRGDFRQRGTRPRDQHHPAASERKLDRLICAAFLFENLI